MTNKALSTLSPFWQSFYTAHPELSITQGHSSQTDARGDTALIYPLPALGLLSITGVDAGAFLQGQLTADINALKPGDSTFAAHCDHKGRMHANGILYCHSSNHFFLQLPASILESAHKALAKYAVFSKITLETVSDNLAAFGSTKQLKASDVNAEVLITIPSTTLNVFWLNHQATSSNDFANQLAHQFAATWCSPADWEQLMIKAGLGFIEAETAGEFIPQMLNLDQLGGISFNKGCYTGQEIIARMKYLGAVKRRCFRFTAKNVSANTELSISTGSPIYHNEQKLAGTVISSVQNSDAIIGLAVLKIDVLNTPLELLLTDDGGKTQHITLSIETPSTMQ